MANLGEQTLGQLIVFFGPKILLAAFCGAIIGLERELKNKSAGMKTNILICVASALLTAVSLQISHLYADRGYFGDPARLAAQIVNGIGFIGAGAIIQSRGNIIGLTTAAIIWLSAAIGITIGAGLAEIGVIVTVSIVLLLAFTNFFENKILGRALSFMCEVLVHDPQGKSRLEINQTLFHNDLVLQDFSIRTEGEYSCITIRYSGYQASHKRFVMELWGIPGVKEVKQL